MPTRGSPKHNAWLHHHLNAYRLKGYATQAVMERAASHYAERDGILYGIVLASRSGKNSVLGRVSQLHHHGNLILIESLYGKTGEDMMIDELHRRGYAVVANGRGAPDAVISKEGRIEAVEVEMMAIPKAGESSKTVRAKSKAKRFQRRNYHACHIHFHDLFEDIELVHEEDLFPRMMERAAIRKECGVPMRAPQGDEVWTPSWPYPPHSVGRFRWISSDGDGVSCRVEYVTSPEMPAHP